jgi:hypothetical protein
MSMESLPPSASAQSIPEALAEYGIWAASPHNSQPWLASIEGDSLGIFPDWKRQLISDPDARLLYVALGCFWGNVRLAAEGLGVTLGEEVNDESIRVRVTSSGGADSPQLLSAIRSRRNNRFPLTGAPDPAVVFSQIAAENLEAHVITEPPLKKVVAQITKDAFKAVLRNRDFMVEFTEWVRTNRSSANDGMPAQSLGLPEFVAYLLPKVAKFFPMPDFVTGREKKLMENAPAIVVICGPDDRRSWLEAGRLFEEGAVRLEMEGYTCAINNSPAEMTPYHEELSRVLGTSARPLLVFRVGRPTKPCRPTPRRPLEEVSTSTMAVTSPTTEQKNLG